MSAKKLEIVEDCPARADAIAAITVEAFAREYGTGEDEAALIVALRADGDVIVELAALDGGVLVGHILFSRVTDEPLRERSRHSRPCARVSAGRKQGSAAR